MADTENYFDPRNHARGPVTIENASRSGAGPCGADQGIGYARAFNDGIVFQSRDRTASWRRPVVRRGTGHGRLGQEAQGRIQQGAACARHDLDGARQRSQFGGDSQFFICFDDCRLPQHQYTVWGKVTSGMENVDKIKRGEPVQNPDKIVKSHHWPPDAE